MNRLNAAHLQFDKVLSKKYTCLHLQKKSKYKGSTPVHIYIYNRLFIFISYLWAHCIFILFTLSIQVVFLHSNIIFKRETIYIYKHKMSLYRYNLYWIFYYYKIICENIINVSIYIFYDGLYFRCLNGLWVSLVGLLLSVYVTYRLTLIGVCI